MSVDIRWDTITSGADGAALAESIRSFIHDKFQQIELPRFISSVNVHSFDFGTVCPAVEIKDICDPLPEFYEDSDDESEDADDSPSVGLDQSHTSKVNQDRLHLLQDRVLESQVRTGTSTATSIIPQQHIKFPKAPPALDTTRRGPVNPSEHLSSAFPRSGTPGIPGGTSNPTYFHLPLTGLSGTQTPLAAVASGTPFSSNGWPHETAHTFPFHLGHLHPPPSPHYQPEDRSGTSGPLTRPSTANTLLTRDKFNSPFSSASPGYDTNPIGPLANVSDESVPDPSPPVRVHPAQPSDLQVVARVKYAGDVRMALTAEILLDYPMPSFVGIPVQLSITGVTFDGVAIVASIRKKAHFCFLSPEDAEALVGIQVTQHDYEQQLNDGRQPATNNASATERKRRGLLQEIKVESEIGRKEKGKQVLKNVGKVEKFVLEQVRRIFEEEFVFPSFWTFLV